PSMKFTDGTPYDAAAVKFNWERAATVTGSIHTGDVAAISSMTVDDPQTLRVKLTAADTSWPRIVWAVGAIASPKAIQAANGNYAAAQPAGAGPFTLKDWLRDDHMTFVRNPGYWAFQQPYLDQVTVRPIVDESQRINTL